VRRAFEVAYKNRNVEAMRSALTEDFEWHQRAEWPGRRVYGVEDLAELWAELEDTYSEYVVEPVGFSESGGCVIAEVHISARLRASDARIDGVTWQVWRLADGLVQDVRVYTERSEAFATAEQA
jgi:hypothetical protein